LPGGFTFVRAISILQDALSLGSYLMILLLILQPFYLFPSAEKERGWWRRAQYLLLLTGLLYTTTRSAWIGMAVGTLALAWRRKKLLATSSAFLFIGIFLLLLLLSFPGGKEFLLGTFLGKETSVALHMNTYGWQFQKIVDNPMGLGLGMTGRIGARFYANVEGGFNTECWYIQVGTQMGFLGFFLYIAIVLEILRTLFVLGSRLRDPFLKDLTHGIFAAYLACSVFGLFLNIWSCHVVPIFMHLFVGMALFHFPHLDADYERSEEG